MADIFQVKQQVKGLVDQGRTEQEIDQFIADQGFTIDQIRNAKLEPTSAPTTPNTIDGDRERALKATKTRVKEMVDNGWQEHKIDQFIADQGFTVDDVANYQIPEKTWGDWAGETAAHLGNNIAFEYGDEALAGVNAVLGNGTYDENLKKYNEFLDDSDTSAKVVGALGSVVVPGLGASAVSRMGLKGAKAAAAHVAGGALEGALYGSGANEEDRAGGAITGAGIGAAAGGVGGLLANKFGKTVDNDAITTARNKLSQEVADGYKAIDDQVVPKLQVSRMQEGLKNVASEDGLLTQSGKIAGDSKANKVLTLANDLKKPTNVNYTRSTLLKAANEIFDPADRAASRTGARMGKVIRDTLDEVTDGALSEVNKKAARNIKARAFQELLDNSKVLVKEAAGQDATTVYRNALTKMMDKDRSLSPDQIEELAKKIGGGSAFGKKLTKASSLGGILPSSALGLSLGDPISAAALWATGQTMNKTGKAMNKKAYEKLIREMMAKELGLDKLPTKATKAAPLLKALQRAAPRTSPLLANPYRAPTSDRDEE